jgi:hypothetical protein
VARAPPRPSSWAPTTTTWSWRRARSSRAASTPPQRRARVGHTVVSRSLTPVPAGQVSQNTLNFLGLLQIPENNDRDWFRAHEPAYRQAEAVSDGLGQS